MLKYIINNMFFLSAGFGCRNGLAQDPTPRPYSTIEASKKNKAFVEELKPDHPFIEIEGRKHFIKNAWIEHPHIKKNFADKIRYRAFCFVVELEYDPDNNVDLKEYIQELGNGPSRDIA